jgi:hypothetical protein
MDKYRIDRRNSVNNIEEESLINWIFYVSIAQLHVYGSLLSDINTELLECSRLYVSECASFQFDFTIRSSKNTEAILQTEITTLNSAQVEISAEYYSDKCGSVFSK